MKRYFVLVVLFVAAHALVATSPSRSAEDRQRLIVDRASTEQKAIYLGKLLKNSVAIKTIETSNDPVAKENLKKARELVVEAQKDVQEARIASADEKLNRALSLVNTDTRRLSQSAVVREHQIAAFKKRMHSVEIFLTAYERVSGGPERSPVMVAQTAKLQELSATAREYATQGRLEEATRLLDQAYELARGDIRDLRDGKTLVRSLDFDTPEKEFTYESSRNDSHVMLLKLALVEKKPPTVFLERIEELRRRAERHRAEAASLAETKDLPAAIEAMSRSTSTLLKAIRMSGLFIPG